MIPGHSCGYPDVSPYVVTNYGEWNSAIPAEVYAAWLAGDGPHPCAWLGVRVSYDVAIRIALPFRRQWSGDIAGPITPFDHGTGADRRLPKGEREPKARTFEFHPDDVYRGYDFDDFPRCTYCGGPDHGREEHTCHEFVHEMTTLSTVPYRLSAEEERRTRTAVRKAHPTAAFAPIRVLAGDRGPMFCTDDVGLCGWEILVGLGWLCRGGR